MDSVPIPLWSIGVLLIVAGPFAVQRLADLWAAAVERRTDEALSAMTARAKGTSVNVADRDDVGATPTVTQQDSASSDDDE